MVGCCSAWPRRSFFFSFFKLPWRSREELICDPIQVPLFSYMFIRLRWAQLIQDKVDYKNNCGVIMGFFIYLFFFLTLSNMLKQQWWSNVTQRCICPAFYECFNCSQAVIALVIFMLHLHFIIMFNSLATYAFTALFLCASVILSTVSWLSMLQKYNNSQKNCLINITNNYN